MKIVTLIDNLVYKKGLLAEHGLAYYIESVHGKILFDTGQTGAFISNAKEMGIDLSDIDYVVISHGHYDHTGGLADFLKLNSKAKVLLKREAFVPKYHGPKKNIGMQVQAEVVYSRLKYVDANFELFPGVFVFSSYPIVNQLDTAFHNFQIKDGEKVLDDTFEDELFIVILKNNKLSIVSSCSHRGISNMVQAAMLSFEKSPLNLVMGGFHLKDENAGQLDVLIRFFNETRPESIGTGHCTGVEMFAKLKNSCSSKVFYNYTGNQINL